jgi:hypothetical protein
MQTNLNMKHQASETLVPQRLDSVERLNKLYLCEDPFIQF